MTTLNDYVINKARVNLSEFVLAKAYGLTKQLGFSYIESDTAPNTFDELSEAFTHSMLTFAPLPVFKGYSDKTVYTSSEANWAFRFWHDVIHASNGYGFTLVDEVKCSGKQMEDVAKYFGKRSDEYRLFVADTVGQSVYAEMHGLFPNDQLEYVKSLMKGY